MANRTSGSYDPRAEIHSRTDEEGFAGLGATEKAAGVPSSSPQPGWVDQVADALGFPVPVVNNTEAEKAGRDSVEGPSGDGGGCYITTACTRAASLPDDCAELTALRQFREEYLAQLPEGPGLLAEYRRIAPELCRRVDAQADAQSVWSEVFHAMIRPAVRLIEDGRYAEARAFYEINSRRLAQRVGLLGS